MNNFLADIPGILCYFDDILIVGETDKVHDKRLHQVIQQLHQEGLTLNKDKYLFHQS